MVQESREYLIRNMRDVVILCSYSADRKFLQSMSLASITFVSNMDASH